MFTFEVRINGSLISHVYGRNVGPDDDGKTRYAYEYYEAESRKVSSGHVAYRSEEGIRGLLVTILNDIKTPHRKVAARD